METKAGKRKRMKVYKRDLFICNNFEMISYQKCENTYKLSLKEITKI